MLLAEHLILLDRKLDGSAWGENRAPAALNRWLAAACLVELTALGRLTVAGAHVVATEDIAAHYMLLNDAQAVLRKRAQTPLDAVDAVHRAMPRIASDLMASLVRRGLLIEEKRRKFGIFSTTTYPVQSTSSYFESVKSLAQGADNLALTDLWLLGLVLLSDGMDLLKPHLPNEAMAIDGRLNRFEAYVSGARVTNDPRTLNDSNSQLSLQRARLMFALTKFD
jgi:hypothetical protein